MTARLTVSLPVRDRDGRILEEREVPTYAGLLARAHEEGLRSVHTEILQIPKDDNGQLAVVIAKVETTKGLFTGLGDASPESVNRRIVPHIVRMAETRAKARALRDAVNIGVVAMEELGDLVGEDVPSEEAPRREPPGRWHRSRSTPELEPKRRSPELFPRENNRSSRPEPMTDAQRRLVFRLLAEQGVEGDDAIVELLNAAGVDDLAQITKSAASRLIDSWRNAGAGNGNSDASRAA